MNSNQTSPAVNSPTKLGVDDFQPSDQVAETEISTLSCECCSYTANNKWAYISHLKSKRHLNLSNPPIDVTNVYYECKNCAKKYKSRTGLWKHKPSCSPKQQTIPTADIIKNIREELQKEMKNEFIELKNLIIDQSKDIKETQHQTINNNNNQQIHIYLNTHCKDAMNIDQFINNMEITADDMKVFLKDMYMNGAIKLLMRNIEKLEIQERPMHCAVPMVNKPSTFFLKDHNEWKEENQGEFMFQTRYVEEFNDETEKMALTKLFEKFGTKLYDKFDELCKTNPKFEQIRNKMASRTSSGEEKMSIVEELAKILVCDQLFSSLTH